LLVRFYRLIRYDRLDRLVFQER